MKIFLSFVFILLPSCLLALPFTDARNVALGGMALSSEPVESALFLNPALLGGSENLKTTFTQVRLSPSNFDFEVSGDFPVSKDEFGIGIGWDSQVSLNQQQTGIVRNSNGQVVVDPSTGLPLTQVLGFFTQNNNVFYLSAGAKFGFFSIGSSLKYYLQDFGSVEGQGFGFDLSAEFHLLENLSIGSTLFDLGNTNLQLNQKQPNLTYRSVLMTSLAWDFLRLGDFSFQLDPGVSSGFGNQQAFQWAAGLEASWHRDIFVRAGINQNQLGLGIGLVAHPEKVFSEVRVDYTYLSNASDGYSSRLTLGVGW